MLVFIASLLLAVVVPPKTTINVVQVKSITINPTSMIGGGTVNGSVTLGAAAGQPITVKLASSAPQIAEVPASVVVQSGATSATFIEIGRAHV